MDCDYYPEVCSLFFRETGQATPSSCFVLHRMGFVMPPCFRSGRWALTPPFHPCFVALITPAFPPEPSEDEAVCFL